MKPEIDVAKVTEANIDYAGSGVSIDSSLMEKADIPEFERDLAWNVNNGECTETYAMPAKANSGTICINGAAARKAHAEDFVTITALNRFTEELG